MTASWRLSFFTLFLSCFALGELLNHRGDTQAAIAAFRATIAADPSHAHAHIELGMLLTQNGGSWDFYSAWRIAVGILCWVLVVSGVAIYLMYDFADDDATGATTERYHYYF